MNETKEQTPIHVIADIHQQVREFVENQYPCKVIKIADRAESSYAPPLSTTKIDKETELQFTTICLSFDVELIFTLPYAEDIAASFKVDVAPNDTPDSFCFVISNRRYVLIR